MQRDSVSYPTYGTLRYSDAAVVRGRSWSHGLPRMVRGGQQTRNRTGSRLFQNRTLILDVASDLHSMVLCRIGNTYATRGPQ